MELHVGMLRQAERAAAAAAAVVGDERQLALACASTGCRRRPSRKHPSSDKVDRVRAQAPPRGVHC
jgi:hypothetical protein